MTRRPVGPMKILTHRFFFRYGWFKTMSKIPKDQRTPIEIYSKEDELEYEEMELLERLETLREDMEDLKVTTHSAGRR
jgi:hypothetical protein